MAEAREAGDWTLEREIGSGSFARVWKATHKSSQQVAAVKEINVDKLNKKLQESLASEVAVLNHTKHQNIVCLLDLIRDNNRLFIVLEFCAGGDLGHYIKRYRQVSEGTARYFLRQLAEGLKELRRHNVIHRDLKPQNLLLSDSSSTPLLKIADFGFARSLAPQGLAETLCGSPLYMAPEILQFHKYDAKADLWSIGTILFELLVGKPPFNGANHMQLLRNIERNEAKLPDHVAARLSGPCKSLLGRLLQRNPVERISFEEFFTHPFLSGTTGPSTGVPPSQPIPAAVAAAPAALPAAMRQAAAAVATADKASAVGMPRPSLHIQGTLHSQAQQQPVYANTPMHTQPQHQWHAPQHVEAQQPQQQHQLRQQPPAAAYPPPLPQHRQQFHGLPGQPYRQAPQQQQQGLVARVVEQHPLAAVAEPETADALSDSMEGDFVVVYNPNGSHKNSGSNSSSSKASSGLVDPKAAAVLQSAAPTARGVPWSGQAAQQQQLPPQQYHHQQQFGGAAAGAWPSAMPVSPQQQGVQQPSSPWLTGGPAVVGASVGQIARPATLNASPWACMPEHSQLAAGACGPHSVYQQPTAAQRVQLLVQVVRGCVSLLARQASGANDTVLPATQLSEQLALMLLALQLVQAMCLPQSVQQQQEQDHPQEAEGQHQGLLYSQSLGNHNDDVCSLADLLAAASQADLEQLMSAAVDLLTLAKTLPGLASSTAQDAADHHHHDVGGTCEGQSLLCKLGQSLMQLPLPDPFGVVYQQALDSCRSAAVEEVMGNWPGSIAGYSLAADLLLFLSYEWKELGTADPGLLIEERHALHRLYDAVNRRLAACVAEAPSTILY